MEETELQRGYTNIQMETSMTACGQKQERGLRCALNGNR